MGLNQHRCRHFSDTHTSIHTPTRACRPVLIWTVPILRFHSFLNRRNKARGRGTKIPTHKPSQTRLEEWREKRGIKPEETVDNISIYIHCSCHPLQHFCYRVPSGCCFARDSIFTCRKKGSSKKAKGKKPTPTQTREGRGTHTV